MPGALNGIKIVDLTNVILGPYGTMLLADQGADIIKVEAPEGDSVRHIGKPGRTPGMGPTHIYVNRNKRSLCLDLKNKDARSALLKVIAGADAFVHALRPQAIQGLGLGYEDLRKIKPDIVYVGAYGYSADGPYGKLPAYDDAIQARFGIADLMGRAAGDNVPRYPPTIIADKTVAIMFAFTTLAALMHKQRTGEGQQVEVPMFETMAAWLLVEHLWERDVQRPGPGRLHAHAGAQPQALPDQGWLDGDPAVHRQALAQLLRRRRPARAPGGQALFDDERPLHAYRRDVRHARGAGADAHDGGMGGASRQGGNSQRPGLQAVRPVR
jgi:crotonobetainyl-CoA:carnitine CoA-transferase CaiB-like acyl-CoA transferase